jgi:hypothetical protein
MSVFEDINHAKISTILLSIWAFVVPGLATYIISNPTMILALLTATIEVKYAAILVPIILTMFLVWYNQHYPGISMPTNGA